MEERLSFMEKVHRSRWKQICFFAVTMIALYVVYSVSMKHLNRRIELFEDDFSWVYQIDDIKEVEGELVINGWAFMLNEDSLEGAVEIVLYDINSGKKYYPQMSYRIRDDVNNYFMCGYDYRKVGFSASIAIWRLNLDESTYQLVLRPRDEKRAFKTNIYYFNEEMMCASSNEYVKLDVEGTDIESVVNEGVCVVNRQDIGMYVYQYNRALYWIAEPYFDFVKNGSWIEFHIETTQTEKLPPERLENGWLWSNLRFDFYDKELVEQNNGRYRIAKYDLPTEYSITKIWTGSYDTDWIWRNDFRPRYDFFCNFVK